MHGGITHQSGNEEEEGFTNPFTAMARELKDTSPPITPWMTYLLIALNLLFFIPGILTLRETPWRLGVSALEFIRNPFTPAVLASMFTHAGILHIVGNMFFLYVVGDNVEAVMGRLRYLVFYLLAGYASIASQSLFTMSFSNDPRSLVAPMVGASGAISGVMAAYLYTYPGGEKYECPCFFGACYCFRVKTKYWILLWILTQFIIVPFQPHIAIFAHIGGFLAGLAMALFFVSRSRVEEIKKLFMEGKYYGLRPSKEALQERSFDIICYLIAGLIMVASVVPVIQAIHNTTAATAYTLRLYEVEEKCQFVIEKTYWPFHTERSVYVRYKTNLLYMAGGDGVKLLASTGDPGEIDLEVSEKAVENLLAGGDGVAVERRRPFPEMIPMDPSETTYDEYVAKASHYADYVYNPLSPVLLAIAVAVMVLIVLAGYSLVVQARYEVL